MKRAPIHKNLTTIAIEHAHGGSGRRQVLLSAKEDVTQNLDAMTKGFLPAGAVFDWHNHPDFDEICVVLAGSGTIDFEGGGSVRYGVDDVFNFPAELNHRIANDGEFESVFYFIRIRKSAPVPSAG